VVVHRQRARVQKQSRRRRERGEGRMGDRRERRSWAGEAIERMISDGWPRHVP